MSKIIDSKVIELLKKGESLPPMSFEDIMPHKIYDKSDSVMAADLITKMLKWVPDDRISAVEALKHPFFSGI